MLYTLEAHEKPSETFCLAVKALQKMIDEVLRNHKYCPANKCLLTILQSNSALS